MLLNFSKGGQGKAQKSASKNQRITPMQVSTSP
jgi:hypothetical protein